MGQKVNPIGIRVGLIKNWQNRWFLKRAWKHFIEEDLLLRKIIKSRIAGAGIADIEIERVGDAVIKIFIKAARPGIVIGHGGKGIDELRKSLASAILKWRVSKDIKEHPNLNISVEELKKSEVSGNVVAYNIAQDLERRMPFRRTLKKYLSETMKMRGVRGAKIKLAGRLDGAEISRREWLASGQMPLQTLRANIDYGEATAFTAYSTIGVKVWIYKGEVFNEKLGKTQM